MGHVSPEAALGGPLAAIRDGDLVVIDIPNRRIHLEVSDEEIRTRLAGMTRPPRSAQRGSFLGLYCDTVGSLGRGAVLGRDTVPFQA